MCRFEDILTSWEGTPHMAGQSCKGVGTDCAGFVAGVLAEAHGKPLKLDRRSGYAMVRSVATKLEYARVERGSVLQEGDVLCLEGENKRIEHLMFVGEDSLWHCDNHCVCRTGETVPKGLILKYVLRGIR